MQQSDLVDWPLRASLGWSGGLAWFLQSRCKLVMRYGLRPKRSGSVNRSVLLVCESRCAFWCWLAPALVHPRRPFVRNLVDPASSHMLVSKIKPCMSQYKLLYGETANGSLKQL